MAGVGYTSVSQERRRLADKMKKDRKLQELSSGLKYVNNEDLTLIFIGTEHVTAKAVFFQSLS